ncbi:RES domain-containing protein [Sphingomonadales bacterium 56]|uniref:RES domain-containing protein n=2 Tax=Sphingobium indicum TaxID=332055 RepID=A0A1L5BRU5_SPHIB|nr:MULTISPECIES: RES family NAD+ phosphorylase [Sphingobium]MBY2930685.1 RES domain-containing protein [Sphingomonadales bacterium 56]MBY2960773.1 RES domain-containing protein [Sphingomonadales bacterium 58]APL95522.1 hypothetical protein SIDU_13935 [Sphingobium indicum B90A]NYI24989.1 hypothetical protein [Sphingobium indicum]RYL96735.1 RES domain-containing protein [Sphingobium indicum]
MSLKPTAAFAGVALDTASVAAGTVHTRIYFAHHPDPLGFGKTPSRFSDPRRRIAANRFGLVYLGSSLKVSFLEAILRDERNGLVGDYPIAETELDARNVAFVAPTRALTLIDLTGDGPVRMGIPSDVARGATQTLARAWSVAIHDHPAHVDGILYPSRLNGEVNVAVYDRAVPVLAARATLPLLRARGLARVLDDLKVALV